MKIQQNNNQTQKINSKKKLFWKVHRFIFLEVFYVHTFSLYHDFFLIWMGPSIQKSHPSFFTFFFGMAGFVDEILDSQSREEMVGIPIIGLAKKHYYGTPVDFQKIMEHFWNQVISLFSFFLGEVWAVGGGMPKKTRKTR